MRQFLIDFWRLLWSSQLIFSTSYRTLFDSLHHHHTGIIILCQPINTCKNYKLFFPFWLPPLLAQIDSSTKTTTTTTTTPTQITLPGKKEEKNNCLQTHTNSLLVFVCEQQQLSVG